MQIYIFLAEGFEEIEAITPIDIFRRAGLKVTSVSTTNEIYVTGAHGISIKADNLFSEIDFMQDSLLFLPGGMPGTTNLENHEGLKQLLKLHHSNNKPLAAICAAPSVLGGLDILKGEEAICYPGFESKLSGAKLSEKAVVKSSNIFTGKGPGKSAEHALLIVSEFVGPETAENIRKAMFY